MDTILPKRFIPHLILVCIWVSLIVYGSMTATIKSPVSVSPAFHMTSASTRCDLSITCSSSDIFQSSCAITSGLSVTCGNTVIQAGEIHDSVAKVAEGAAGSSHSWTASSSSSVVTPTPSSGTFTLDSSGPGTFNVKVVSVITLSGSDTVAVSVS